MANLRLRYLLISCLVLLLTLGPGHAIAQQPAANNVSEQVELSCPNFGGENFSLFHAQTLYKFGCYKDAARILEVVSQQGDDLTQAIAYSNLSLTYQQLNHWEDAEQAIDTAFARIATAKSSNRAVIQAQAFDVRGQLQLSRGQAVAAADSWQQATQLYSQLDMPNRAALSQIKQARSLQTLGLFHQVKVILKEVVYSLLLEPDSEVKALALRQLADTLWMTGSTEVKLPNDSSIKANEVCPATTFGNNADNSTTAETDQKCTVLSLLLKSANVGETLGNSNIQNAAILSVGNFYRNQFFGDISQPQFQNAKINNNRVTNELIKAYNDLTKALYAYEQVAIADSNSLLALQARLNQLSLQAELALSAKPPQDVGLSNAQRQYLNNADNHALGNWFIKATANLPEKQKQRLQVYIDPVALQSLYASIKNQLGHTTLTQGQQTIQPQPDDNIFRSGRQAVYAYVQLAQSLITWKKTQLSAADQTEVLALLKRAEQQGRHLNDEHALSYVLGYQGKFYELISADHQHSTDLQTAITLTSRALAKAQSIRANDISYQWQHQLGRLHKAKGDTTTAIKDYKVAFETLEKLRPDLIAANANQPFYFKNNIEPIYRELVALLLNPNNNQPKNYLQTKIDNNLQKTPQSTLKLVQRVMDSLQEGELENFFQAACVDTTTAIGQALKRGDAGIYPILLDDRLEVLLELPTASLSQKNDNAEETNDNNASSLQRFSVKIENRLAIENLLVQIQRNLDSSNPGAVKQLKIASQELYQYLFNATEEGLEDGITLETALAEAPANSENNTKTLVFVLDSPFRTIPLGILYDNKRDEYLLEKYAIALNLGIDVRDSDPLPAGSKLRVLAAGVAEPPPALNQTPLPYVRQELDIIEASQASVQRLQEEEFTQEQLNQQLNNTNYQIVHLATHGQFSSNRNNAYIVAHDREIRIDELSTLFRNTQAVENPVELIVFSACRTATGDDLAVLGLAGAIVQAGARSAIATLWGVDDAASVTFAESFYKHLNSGSPNPTSRAVALQAAQRDLKQAYADSNTPFNDAHKYWAPYILIGSWH